jgi:hypothetical protein
MGWTAEPAAEADSSAFAIPRTFSPVRVDGILDEEAWTQAWVWQLAYEVEPGENIPAPVRTEVLLIHDHTHLFVAFRAFDPEPAAIRAHLSDRDDAWSDDWVAVILDTFNDERRNYLLGVNPLGVQLDTIEAWPEGNGEWDGIWHSAAKITDWGWTAELKIPFSTLRFQRSSGPQLWGFDAIRGYPRLRWHKMGAFPRDRSNNCYLCQAIKIEGFDGVSPGRNLEVVPTLTAARTETREDFPHGPLDSSDYETEAGITARWGFTPNLTLAATLNPDFSQVEADARQLDINEPFALFFPEKRPFFMEGADFFETLFDAVYTRTIRDPSWGLKLTGKEGRHTVGAYVAEDDVTNLIFPGSQGSGGTSLAMQSTAAVLRYKHDIGNRYTLGFLLTDREGHSYFNRVAGVDADLRFNATERVRLQLLGSSTRYPDAVAEEFAQPAGQLEDWAAELLYEHGTRSLSWWALVKDVGADFRADLGFMPKVDERGGEVGVDYVWNATDTSWYSSLNLKVKVDYTEDHEGNLLAQENAVRFTMEGPLQSHAFLRPSRKREGYNGLEFELDEVSLHGCMKPNAHSHLWLNATIGDRIDYTNTRLGDRLHLSPGFTYRFGRHLSLDLRHTFERMNYDGQRLFEANISQLTTAYYLNPRAFFRAIFQHVAYDYNVALYNDDRDPEFRHLFTQLLFSYKLNPHTVLFLGYSDNSFGSRDIDLTRSDRTVFVKLGYAWVP